MPFRMQLPSLPKCTEDALRVQVWGFEKQESAQAVWSNPSPSRVRQQQCDVTAEIAASACRNEFPPSKVTSTIPSTLRLEGLRALYMRLFIEVSCLTKATRNAFFVVDTIFIFIFMLEWCARVWFERWNFVKDFANLFDTVLVMSGVADLAINFSLADAGGASKSIVAHRPHWTSAVTFAE